MRRNAPMIGATSTKFGSTPLIRTSSDFTALAWPYVAIAIFKCGSLAIPFSGSFVGPAGGALLFGDAGFVDDVAPFGDVGRHAVVLLLRRGRAHVDAEPPRLLLQVRRRHRALDRGVERLDHVRRQPRRTGNAVPA